MIAPGDRAARPPGESSDTDPRSLLPGELARLPPLVHPPPPPPSAHFFFRVSAATSAGAQPLPTQTATSTTQFADSPPNDPKALPCSSDSRSQKSANPNQHNEKPTEAARKQYQPAAREMGSGVCWSYAQKLRNARNASGGGVERGVVRRLDAGERGEVGELDRERAKRGEDLGGRRCTCSPN